MAFRVEMYNGSSGKEYVGYQNDDGDLAYRLVSDKGASSDYRYFSCSMWVWDDVIDFAKKLGWEPKGTIQTVDKNTKVASDYEPLCYESKLFQKDDASSFADVLEIAIKLLQDAKIEEFQKQNPILLKSDMTEEDFKSANRNLTPDFLFDFILFLRKGEFSFGYDDD